MNECIKSTVNVNFELVEITEKTPRSGFSLYAVDDGHFFNYGSREEIAQRFCKFKGIDIKIQPIENGICSLYANNNEYARVDSAQFDGGLPIEDCYYLYFPYCLNDKNFKVYGLKIL